MKDTNTHNEKSETMTLTNAIDQKNLTEIVKYEADEVLNQLKSEGMEAPEIFNYYRNFLSLEAEFVENNYSREEQRDMAEKKTADSNKKRFDYTDHGSKIYDPNAGSESECYTK